MTKKKKWIIAGVIIVLVGVLAAASITIVPTGYTGVRTTFGQIDAAGVSSGINFKLPFIQSIRLVNNKQQEFILSEQVWSESADQTVLFMENVALTYQIAPERSAWIYANVNNYESTLVSGTLVSSALKAASVQLPTRDATNRSKIEPIAKEELQRAFDEKYGAGTVNVLKVVINNMNFEDEYNQAIEKRQIAQMAYEQAQIENKTKVEQAQAEAEATRARAKGEADAEITRARAKAEANEIISKSITEQTIRQDTIEKWDGKLPAVSGSSSMIIDPSSIIESSKTE